MTDAVELARELDRVLERELRAGADREMRRMRRVAHQHHVGMAVVVAPAPADEPVELQPGGTALVACVRHQARAVEHFREEVFAEGNGGVLIEFAEAVGVVGLLRRLHDEGRGVLVELVDMRLKPAVFRLAEVEGEGVVELVGAEPDVSVRADLQVGLESRCVLVAQARVDAVGRDDQVGVGKFVIGFHVAFENEFDAERFATRLKNIEQLLAPDADEPVARCANAPALEEKLDVVPMIEGVLDLSRRLGITGAHAVECRVGENDSPSERVVRAIALDDGDAVLWLRLLHQEREIEAGRTTADTYDAHVVVLLSAPTRPA